MSAAETNLDVQPKPVLENKTLSMLDQHFPDSEEQGMPDDALDNAGHDSK